MDTLTLLTITETCPPRHAILLTDANGVGVTLHKECAPEWAKDAQWRLMTAEHIAVRAEAECAWCGDMLEAMVDHDWLESIAIAVKERT